MDVEAILREIRARVVSDVRASDLSTEIEASSNGSAPQPDQIESLTRVSAHLAVTGRSWDRLPPVISNRHGTLGRIELWIKKKSKPLTRWFTWEQINFNRSVNDALCDVVEILKAEAHELASMRAQLTREMRREFSTLRSEADEQARRLQDIEAHANQTDHALTQVDQSINSLAEQNRNGQNKLAEQYLQARNELTKLTAEHSALQADHANLQTEHSKLANQVIELAGQLREEDRQIKSQQDLEVDRRLIELAAELKEEQRVCFRQVSLEASESAVIEDRSRRALLERLEQLEAALKAARRG
jgi:DNA repair exonuclease SbcCD ATPase subunit